MSEPQPRIYEFGDFRVDAAKRQLTKANDETLPLTPKVFDTLLYLVRNDGKVISKDELIREIWTDTVVEENNLSQNISALRRILGEKAGEGRFIATVPGRGFRFVPEVRDVTGEDSEKAGDQSAEKLAENEGPEPNKTAETDPDDPVQRTEKGKLNRTVAIVLSILILLSVGFLGAFFLWRQSSDQAASGTVKTIAILPFKPLVAENRDEALEMGMADTLIARLGNNREIIVRPLSAVRKFGGMDQDALAAGRSLGVEAVLDGSIQRWGDDIRINARLVRVADGTSLWTGTFDEKFAGIFTVQDAISNRVAAALSLRLGSDERARLTRHQTDNVEAYQLYLKGRVHVFKLIPPEVQKGIAFFQQAIARDPAYALPHAGLADAYRSLALGSEMQPTEFLSKSKAAARKAVELDSTLSEAHTALAMTVFWGDWNWVEAESHFKRALELDPNSANAHLFYAHLLSNLGRHSEALAEIKVARELDPLFPFAGALEGQFLTFAGQPDEALEGLRKTSELEPNFWMPHLFASNAYILKGMYAEAVDEARLTRKLSPLQTTSISYEGYAFARAGRREEARATLDELLKLSTERFVPPCHLAIVYSGLDERDNALDWLERGYEQRDTRMTFLKIDPKMDNLRGEPRFVDLMRRMNF